MENGCVRLYVLMLMSLPGVGVGGCLCACMFHRVTLTARLTAGIPGPQECGNKATGALVILGTM